jgi:hypothetical protein
VVKLIQPPNGTNTLRRLFRDFNAPIATSRDPACHLTILRLAHACGSADLQGLHMATPRCLALRLTPFNRMDIPA